MTSIFNGFKSFFQGKDIYLKEFDDIKSLKGEPDSYFERGKEVRIINNEKYVKYFLKQNYGWDQSMVKCLNQKCIVCETDYDNMIRIRTPSNQKWWVPKEILQAVDQEDRLSQSTISIFGAIEVGNLDLFQNLLDLNNLNSTDENGRTPINLACCLGNLEFVKILIDFGADIEIPDNEGNSPISNCELNGHFDIKKYLENFSNVSISRNHINSAEFKSSLKTLDSCGNNVRKKKKENFLTGKHKSNEIKSSLLPISLLDPPRTLFVPEPRLLNSKIYVKHLEKSKSNQSILNLLNPPEDDNISVSKLNLKFGTDSDSKSKKIICKHCSIRMANYVVKSCGHCFCESCLETINVCTVCGKELAENILKIYVPRDI